MAKDKATAEPMTLALDKEKTRELVLQAAGFLRIFGGAFPRLRAIAAFLNVIAAPAVWDVLWNTISADPQAMAALASPFHEGAEDFKGLGTQSEVGAKFLAFIQATGDRPADYYTTKAAIAGILMMAYGFASMTKTTRDDLAIQDLMQIFQQYYDQFYDHQRGNAAAA